MSERRILTPDELSRALPSLTGWSVINGKLHKEFKLRDFKRAFGFMASVALIAESLDHHPDWSNVYNRVVIDLVTHDLGGISTMDVKFAEMVEGIQ